VEPAELLDHLLARPEVEVVGVAEDDVRTQLAHLVRMQALDRRLRPDRHERGSGDLAVRRAQHPRAGRAVLRDHGERAHRISIASPKE
jgi:hypothetical protein